MNRDRDLIADKQQRLAELEFEFEEISETLALANTKLKKAVAANAPKKKLPNIHRGREILAALESLGGIAHYKRIAERVAKARRARGEPVPQTLEASVRNGLQRHCALSPEYGGHGDFFRNPRRGIWQLVSYQS